MPPPLTATVTGTAFSPGTSFLFDPVPDSITDGIAIVDLTPTNVGVGSSGSFSVVLVATNDPAYAPINWTYHLTGSSPTGDRYDFYFSLPSGSTLNLATLPQIASSAGSFAPLLPFTTVYPTGSALLDTTNIEAAIDQLAVSGGTVCLLPSIYRFSSEIIFPDGVNLVGVGSGWNGTKTSSWGALLLATGANAKITFNDSGGYSGQFTIDGDNVATGTLMETGVGTGRTFDCVLVRNSLGKGLVVYGLQNSLFTNLQIKDCVGDLLTLDNGAAYNVFEKFEIAGTNGYHLVVTETTGTGPLGTSGPTNNHFLHGIFEYSIPFATPNTAVGVAHLTAGQTFFDGCALSSSRISTLSGGAVILVDDTAPAAPLGATVFFDDCFIQGYATATPHVGIKQLAGAIRLRGYTTFADLANGWLFNGGTGRIQHEIVLTNTAALFDPASTQSTASIIGVQHASLMVAGYLQLGSLTGPFWRAGAGSPEGAITAPVGSLWTRTDGGAVTTFYVKESGAGNTGWVAK